VDAALAVRYDALSGRTVIVATDRAARPQQFRTADAADDAGPEACPFCPGHEQMTPPEIMRTGEGGPGEPGWRVRVFPNLYPLTDAHEVVVLSPDHYRSLGRLDDTAAIEVFTVLRDRVAALLDARCAAAVAIVNHKREAGASLPHPHAQVIGTSFLPPELAAAGRRAREADDDLLLADAMTEGMLVSEAGYVRAWCPYASSAPFLVRIADLGAGSRFDEASDDTVAGVAAATRDVLARLDHAVDDPPYNLVVNSAAPHTASDESFRWYVEVTPRLTIVAGLELATGLLVNTVAPEHAAKALSEAHG
jgi:UDPglucose--hexose-1-phosphate uridylyltransferase